MPHSCCTRSRLWLLLAIAICSFASTAARAAEAPDPKDVKTIRSCLNVPVTSSSSQEGDETRCLLKIAKDCIGDAGAASDAKQVACYDREQLAWDKIVNDAFKTMVNALDPDQVGKLREMQRAWIHDRDLTCGFWYVYFQGTMANPMIASCQNRETARRGIFLNVFAVDISERK